MTMMLASVTGTAEAEIALAQGADIIDLKDPSKGALGALAPDDVREAVEAIARRRPTSAVTGDLPMEPDALVTATRRMAETGVDYVKVGLFPGAKRADCVRALAPVAARTKLVAVMFADAEPDIGLIPLLVEAGFAGAMLDTARKGAGRLMDHADLAILGRFVETCRKQRLMAGLAGSLEAPDVPRLLLLAPDYLGFRGALCAAHDRKAAIDAAAVSLIRGLIPPDPRGAARTQRTPQTVDFWLHAAPGYAGQPKDGAATDRLLVRDFIVPVRIGAYDNEHAAAQDVCFNVDAEIIRATQPAQDMRDVLSYDIIRDGIRLIAAGGHIELVETLAERIANFVLDHPRVQRVTVRVEKLQAGAGRVGIEISRQRAADVANIYHLYPTAAGRGGES